MSEVSAVEEEESRSEEFTDGKINAKENRNSSTKFPLKNTKTIAIELGTMGKSNKAISDVNCGSGGKDPCLGEKDSCANNVTVPEQNNSNESNKEAEHKAISGRQIDSSSPLMEQNLAEEENLDSSEETANKDKASKTTDIVSTVDKPKLCISLSQTKPTDSDSDAESDDELALHIDESLSKSKNNLDSDKDASLCTTSDAELKATEPRNASLDSNSNADETSLNEDTVNVKGSPENKMCDESPVEDSVLLSASVLPQDNVTLTDQNQLTELKTNQENTLMSASDLPQDNITLADQNELTELKTNQENTLKLNNLRIKLQKFKELNRTWQNRKPTNEEIVNSTIDRTNLFDSFSDGLSSSSTEQHSQENSVSSDESKDEQSSPETVSKNKNVEDHSAALQEELKSLNLILGGETSSERSKENPPEQIQTNTASLEEKNKVSAVFGMSRSENTQEQNDSEETFLQQQKTDQPTDAHSHQQQQKVKQVNDSCSKKQEKVQLEEASLQENKKNTAHKDLSLQENQAQNINSDLQKQYKGSCLNNPCSKEQARDTSGSSFEPALLSTQEEVNQPASTILSVVEKMLYSPGREKIPQETSVEKKSSSSTPPSEKTKLPIVATRYIKPNYKNYQIQTHQTSTAILEDTKQIKEKPTDNKEDNTTENEMDMKLYEIFNLQEKPEEIASSKEQSTPKTNESLKDILRLGSGYTPVVHPKPVPLNASDVDWPVLGVKRCTRCGFTTSDESMLQVHTCRRPSLTMDHNTSNEPLFRKLGMTYPIRHAPGSKTLLTSQVGSSQILMGQTESNRSGARQTLTNQPGSTQKSTNLPGSTHKLTNPPGSTHKLTNPPGSTDKFTNPPRSTDKFTNPPRSTDKFTNPPGSTQKFTNQPGSTHMFTNPPGSTQKFNNQPGSTEKFTNLPGNTQMFTNPPGNTQMFTNQPGSTQMFTNQPGNAQKLTNQNGSTNTSNKQFVGNLPMFLLPASTRLPIHQLSQSTSGTTVSSTMALNRIKTPSLSPKSHHNIRCKITYFGKNKFFCCVCNFSGEDSPFIKHLIEHMLEYPYSCQYCKSSGVLLFQHESEVKAHVETHRDISDTYSMFGKIPAKAFMEKVVKDGYDFLPSIWMKGARPLVDSAQSVPVMHGSGAGSNKSQIPQTSSPKPIYLQFVGNLVPTQAMSPITSTCSQSNILPPNNSPLFSVMSSNNTVSTAVQPTASANTISIAVPFTTLNTVSTAVPFTTLNTVSTAVPFTTLNTVSTAVPFTTPNTILKTVSATTPNAISTAVSFTTSTNMISTTVQSTDSVNISSKHLTPIMLDKTPTNLTPTIPIENLQSSNNSKQPPPKEKSAVGKINLVVGKIENMMVCTNCKFSSASAELFRKHVWDHLHEVNTPCRHKKSASPSWELCPHVKYIMSSVHHESPGKTFSQNSGVVEKDLAGQNTSQNNESMSRGTGESLQLEDDDDCQIIEEEKLPPIVVDLTEEDDEPNSSNTEATAKIPESAVNIAETDLKITATFSLSNDSSVLGPDPVSVSSDVSGPKNIGMETGKRSSMFYVCGFKSCLFSCITSDQFKHHVLVNHRGADVFPCAHCAYKSPGEEEFFRHMNTHTSAKMFLLYKCAFDKCRFGTNLISEFEQHNNIVHKDANCYACMSCKADHTALSDLIAHFQSSLLKFVQCPYCSVKSKDRRTILTHISELHPGKPRQITVTSQLACQHQNKQVKRASEPRSLTPSIEKLPVPPSSVDQCNIMTAPPRTDPTPDQIDEHNVPIRSVNTDQSPSSTDLKCKVCPFVTRSLVDFNKHFKEHEVVQIRTESRSPDSTTGDCLSKFSCPTCKKGFPRYDQLEKHVSSIHKDLVKITLFRCRLCSFTSTSVSKTQKHFSLRHPGKPNILRLSRKIRLEKTVDTETKETNVDYFHCDQCDFSSNERSEFSVHYLSHNKPEDNKPEDIEENRPSEVASTTPNKSNPEEFQLPKENIFSSSVKCPECHYTTNVRVNLLRHMKYHKSWDPTEHKMTCSPGKISPTLKKVDSSPVKTNSNEKTTSPGKYIISPVGTSPKRKQYYSCKLCSYRASSVHKVDLHLAHCKNKPKKVRKCIYCNHKCNSNNNLYMHHRKEHMGLPFKGKETAKEGSTENISGFSTPQKRKASKDEDSNSKKMKTVSPDLTDLRKESPPEHIPEKLLLEKSTDKEANNADERRNNVDQSPIKSNTTPPRENKDIAKISQRDLKYSTDKTPKERRLSLNRDRGTKPKTPKVQAKQSFKCGKCNIVTASKNSFACHFKTRHGFKEEPVMISVLVYQCVDCGRKFRQKHDAETHNLRCIKRVLKESKKTATEKELNDVEDPEDVNCNTSLSSATEEDTASTSSTAELSFTSNISISPCTDTKPYKCQFCNYASSRRSHIKEHYLSHLNGSPYICPYCEYGCRRTHVLVLHMQTNHPDEKERVTKNEKLHQEIESLINKGKPISSPESVPMSPPLRNTAKNSDEIKQERRCSPFKTSETSPQYDPSNPYHCKTCKYTTVRKKNLWKHEKRHSAERLKCTLCEYEGLFPYSIKNHFVKHHPGAKVSSVRVSHAKEICEKETLEQVNESNLEDNEFVVIGDEDSESKLQAHFPLSVIYVRFQDPTNRTSFKCEICEYRCFSSSLIAAHVYTHMPQCFQCIYCDYKSYPSSAITCHIKRHHEGPIKCKYYMNAGLNAYNKLLSKLGKPFYQFPIPKEKNLSLLSSPEEEVSGKGVKRRKKALISDSESDSEEINVKRPTVFCCHLCKFKIKDITKYREHLTLHEAFMNPGLGKSKCGFCSFSSQDPKEFQDHVATHVSERPFKCSYCDYSCFSKKSVVSHLKYKHPAEKISYSNASNHSQITTSHSKGINLNPSVVIMDTYMLTKEDTDKIVKTNGLASMEMKELSNAKLVEFMKKFDLATD